MPSWRCPHCSTPQEEASRCWVCHRSSTSCATCRHFRQSVAARVGFCGLDRQRLPLNGDEVRACWEDAATPISADPVIPGLLDLLVEPSPADPGAVKAPSRFVEVAVRREDGVGDPDPSPAVRRHARDWVEVGAEARR